MKNIYFVISLPRTGTKSISKMAHVCGLNFKHAPVNTFDRDYRSGKNFFADTPCYVPSFIENVIKINGITPKFIYIEKDFTEIFNSWKKVNLYRNYISMYNSYIDEESRKKMGHNSIKDFESLNECFLNTYMDENNYYDLFEKHKQKVLSIVKENNKEILMYRFSDGWEPFCNFLNCEVPNINIPHLNINTMFEKIL